MLDRKPTAFERDLAIVDVETTGLDWDRHEIIDIGLLRVDQNLLAVKEEWETRVQPERPEEGDPRSLEIAGWNEEDWQGSLPLREAMRQFADKVEGCIFMAHPMTVDFSFLDRAFKKTGIENPMHYHQLDLFSMVWALKREDESLPKVTLHELTKHFDLEGETMPHHAINGARLAFEILKKLVVRENETR